MAKRRDASEKRLDELYREHPEGFVAGRDELAKGLRADGDGEKAKRVKKLRRPTAAAWAINRAALTAPREAEEFADASRRLEDAQARALEGGDEDASEWRAAAAREDEARSALADVAERGARDAGQPLSDRSLELVIETLRAATADAELRELVVRGRVEREQSAATLGAIPAGRARQRDRRSDERRQRAQARRELERLEDELADATAREQRLSAQVERTTEALREEKRKLAETRREASALKRRVAAARRGGGSRESA
ncbi:MAG TPA: hypothetical protein VK920_06540 [Solirubrobacterales bacterium]|nr:hypothetical protein [Solirubrobacterales bacterium]